MLLHMALLPFLLLSFLFLSSESTTITQTLTLTSLQPPPPLSPDFTDPISFSSSKSKSSPSPSLRFPLANIDSLSPHSTSPSSLLRLRLSRDVLRASLISRRGSGAFAGPVTSGLAQGSGEYFTRIAVGTPPSFSFLILDTGSDILWLQCKPCRRCYTQSDPIFDSSRSRSYSSLNCSNPHCVHLDTPGCDTRTNKCQYQVNYGDGSFTTGDLATETFTFRSGIKIRRVAFGCGHDNEGLFVAAAGLLGLGRGPLSFPAQAGRGRGRPVPFSYCLVDRTSSLAAANSTKSSFVVFGKAAVPKSRPVQFTPMLHNPKMETFYYVSIAGVSVGGKRVAFDPSVFKLDPETGHGGAIVDSGTSVTRLARPAYNAVRDAFVAGAGLKKVEGGFALFDTCFDLEGKTTVTVPTVALHFAGGAKVSLPAENYLIPVDTKGTFCFALAGTDGVSIIGNIQQQGFRVVFDAAHSRVGFAASSC